MGLPRRVLASCSFLNGRLYIFISAECQQLDQLPVPEMIEMIAGYFGISTTSDLGLLYTLFSEENFERIREAFARQGHHPAQQSVVPWHQTLLFQMHGGRTGDLVAIPNPSEHSLTEVHRASTNPHRESTDPSGVRYEYKAGKAQDEDDRCSIHRRQLPVRVTILDDEKSKDIDEEVAEDDEDMEYLGQVLVSSLLRLWSIGRY